MKKETKNTGMTISAQSAYLLRILRSYLNAEAVPEKPDDISWEQVYAESRRHNLSLIVLDAVKNLKNGPRDNLREQWQKYAERLLTKGINQTLDADMMLNKLNAAGIRIMPLKGYYVRQTYPTAEMREMTDLDVLVEDPLSGGVRSQMKELGCVQGENADYHVSYVKKPYLLVEMHSKLIPESSGHADYFSNAWSRAAAEPDRPYVYHMNSSDILIHLVMHFWEHYFWGGCCGIRFAMDFYTYCRHYEKELDWKYIRKELKKLKMLDTADTVFGLAQAWFGSGTLTEKQAQMGERIVASGAFGNAKERQHNEIARLSGKNGNLRVGIFRYYLRAVFLPLEDMKRMYPVLEKAPILLPFMWIARWFRVLFKTPKHILERYREAKKKAYKK